MTISITKTVKVEEKLNFKNLKVIRTNLKDIDSTNLEIYYNNEQIGYGHLNNRTNFAHININDNLLKEEDECDLIDYLTDGIENSTINY
tara:strand:- start:1638 stop:1904 length:267 start_codon:yes stop_codon:yes gene_type:complete